MHSYHYWLRNNNKNLAPHLHICQFELGRLKFLLASHALKSLAPHPTQNPVSAPVYLLNLFLEYVTGNYMYYIPGSSDFYHICIYSLSPKYCIFPYALLLKVYKTTYLSLRNYRYIQTPCMFNFGHN